MNGVHVVEFVFLVFGGGQRVDLGAARVGENLMGDHWWRPYFSWKENQKDEARRQLAHQL